MAPTVTNTAFTLADYASSNKPLIAGVAQVLREASPLMDLLKFVDAGTLSINVIRAKTLPTVGWRKIGAQLNSSKGSVDMIEETAFDVGNAIDVDKLLVRAGNTLYNPRALWQELTVKAIAYEFNDCLINGDPTVNSDRPTGIMYRVTNDLASTQRISAAALDISPDTGSNVAPNANQLMDLLDKVIYALPDHKCDALLMNETALLRAWSSLRQINVLDVTKDEFGREFYTYKGARMVDVGPKADFSTKIILDTESATGLPTGATYTSIYGLRIGPQYFTGWQMYPMDVQDLGLIDDGVTYRNTIDWPIGFAVTNPRSIVRAYYLQAI